MFSFTRQERQVLLFLSIVALAGIGISFCVKINTPLEKAVSVHEELTKLDLNLASVEDLVLNKVATIKLAQSIIDYRNENGDFCSLEDLKKVKGIGDHRYERMKEGVYVK
ncbi:MAG: helix-hairpin-helix domain-containing protein [Candidatus Omnitrophota bacterium]|jgi:competence ComEA-like helix-hairpin-helix protein